MPKPAACAWPLLGTKMWSAGMKQCERSTGASTLPTFLILKTPAVLPLRQLARVSQPIRLWRGEEERNDTIY